MDLDLFYYLLLYTFQRHGVCDVDLIGFNYEFLVII